MKGWTSNIERPASAVESKPLKCRRGIEDDIMMAKDEEHGNGK